MHIVRIYFSQREKSKSSLCNKMGGQINSGNIIVGIAIVLVVVFLAYNLGSERSNRPDSFVDGAVGGVTGQGVHFITARTYGLVPKTVADTGRIASVKAGGSGQLYGAAQPGANLKQSLTGTTGASVNNPHIRPQHTEAKDNPLLRHQRIASGGNLPTVQGDPIRTPTYIGPSVAGYRLYTYNQPWKRAYDIITAPDFSSQVAQVVETQETKAQIPQAPIDGYTNMPYTYDIGTRGPGGPDSLGPGSGPYPGMPLGVPVPRGSLKKTSEKYGYPFYKASRPLKPYDYFKPFGPNQNVNQDANYVDTPFYARGMYSTGYTGDIPFISSVDAFAPFPEVNSDWEKTGMLTTKDPEKGGILNLYRRPVAPLQDLFKYSVQDKNGFIIPLKENYLEDGDTVPDVIGKGGPWNVHVFTKDKYVWV